MFTMLAAPYAALLGVCCVSYFVLYPAFVYFRDPKGMATASDQADLEPNVV
jgi:hypothetical protein